MTANVLLIESARVSAPSFAPDLQKRGYNVSSTHSGKEAVLVGDQEPPDVIVLDAAALRTSGTRICSQLRSHFGDTPIIHIKSAAENGRGSEANVTLYHPFTPRKLINRIERFLNAGKGEIISSGSFKLNLHQRLLTAHGKEHRLTPKLAQLMETFMRNPSKTLDREYLMRNVWQTEYMGDTRTLDVHIRWIREAVEGEPGKPRFIITVRGKGYRFEPDVNGHI